VVEFRPASEYSLTGARSRLLNVKIPHLSKDFTTAEAMLHKTSLINMDNTEGICCAGALINYLQKGDMGFQYDGDEFEVNLKMFSM